MADAVSRPPRLALLIAQEIYRTGSGFAKLNTPVAGALELADELEACGFEVTLIGDEPGREEPYGLTDLITAIDHFAEGAAKRQDAIVFFYFAGHGLAHGDDYLMMSETARLQEIRAGGLDLNFVKRRLDRNDDGFLILAADACRGHPFPAESERLRRGLPVSGMAEVFQRQAFRPHRGLVAISAGDGEVVFDDPGGIGKSLFTAELIKALRVPGDSANTVFHRVMESVSRVTSRRQRPVVVAFEGSLDTVLNEARKSSAEISTRAQRNAPARPWANHKGPLVSVTQPGQDPGVHRPGRRILLALAHSSGWSLNPLSVLSGDDARRWDIAATFSEILSAGCMPGSLTMSEEREARLMLSTLLRMLVKFRFKSLHDITRLDLVWQYLCETGGQPQLGNVMDEPVMAFAMMADRLAAISAQDSPEYRQLTDFLSRARHTDKKQGIAIRDRIALAAVRPLRNFQGEAFRRAMSPGNVDLHDVLRDPTVHIVIEHDARSAPAVQATTGLWLAAIRIAATDLSSRPPLMIHLPYGPAPGTLPFQMSTADIVAA